MLAKVINNSQVLTGLDMTYGKSRTHVFKWSVECDSQE